MSYAQFFERLSDEGYPPYPYQVRVAEALSAGKNVVIRAPTGCGKTKAVLAPFLFAREKIGAARLIYALPLRTLAQGVYQEAQDLRDRCRRSGLAVTIQTGEQPNDPFFSSGDIIVTTYDQLLSGLLCGPYGLSDRLHNINAAAATGTLVVFDEFHLMEPERAFLTAVGCQELFGRLTLSVWMTATATSPLVDELRDALGVQERSPTKQELVEIPAVGEVDRAVVKEAGTLNAEAILAYEGKRTIAVVNQVGRAQKLYRETSAAIKATGLNVPITLLHSRFFAPDRQEKQQAILRWFGERGTSPAILIATQVIEAGLNLTCDHLHTEICPMNALVQRAGRCARFKGETGTVHVHASDGDAKPYEQSDLQAAWSRLPEESAPLTPDKVAEWVELCHAAADTRKVGQGWRASKKHCMERILKRVQKLDSAGVSDLIRRGSDDVRVIVHDNPGDRPPGGYEGVSVYRDAVKKLASKTSDIGWYFTPAGDWAAIQSPHEVDKAYAVCLKTDVARYTKDIGIEIGCAGTVESPRREPPPRPGHRPLKRESWVKHTRKVIEEALARMAREARPGGLLADCFDHERLHSLARLVGLLHDLGKLQQQWQEWAENTQKALDAAYRHTALLAHTDYDAGRPANGQRTRQIRPARPPHAMASAFYGFRAMTTAFQTMDRVEATACLAAVVSHHGGWLGDAVLPLHSRGIAALRELEPAAISIAAEHPVRLAIWDFKEEITDTAVDKFEEWWPLASYLTRTLRLSDQLATEESNNDA